MRGWLVVAVLVLFTTSAQSQVTVVGFWNFDEGSGVQATDSSGEAMGDCNQLLEDGFESGDTSSWALTIP